MNKDEHIKILKWNCYNLGNYAELQRRKYETLFRRS